MKQNCGSEGAATEPVGQPQWWNEYFADGGGWEQNGGRAQTRLFAQHFCSRVQLPASNFTMLDVGCALGDAVAVFAQRYPEAKISGVDASDVAIGRCREELGDVAQFSVAGIDDVRGVFDVIYISNVLEHFADYKDKARRLMQHCRRLCVMVPFHEMRNGRELEPSPGSHHQVTFERQTFDYLREEGRAASIETFVLSCPGAWGWTWPRWAVEMAKNMVRPLVGRPKAHELLQIIYDIRGPRL